MESKIYQGYYNILYKISTNGFVLASYDNGTTWQISAFGSNLARFKEEIDKGAMLEVKADEHI